MATQALILAAGRGSRMGKRTDDIPKPLLQVGHNRLIDHQLEMLASAGVGPVAMVLGYRADEIIEYTGVQVDYLYNHNWSSSNSLFSFLQAAEWIEGDFILMNCDILLHPQILDRLLNNGPDCFAYDSLSGSGREHMKVHLENDGLMGMSKIMQQDRVSGENVGILYFSRQSGRRLIEIANEQIESGHHKNWVGVAVQQLAKEKFLKGVDIAGLPWAEIDFEYDLVRARKEVLPKLRKSNIRSWKTSKAVSAMAVIVLLLFSGLLYSFIINTHKSPSWHFAFMPENAIVAVTNDDDVQQWFKVAIQDSIVINISGPQKIKIETRAIVDNDIEHPEPATIEIKINGTPIKSLMTRQKRSKTVRMDCTAVSKVSKAEIDISSGTSRLTISNTSYSSSHAVVRIREIVELVED